MTNKRALFFDLDGTLVENEHLKAQAFCDTVKEFGGRSHPSMYKEVMGESGSVISKHFIGKAGIDINSAAYFQVYKSKYTELLKGDLQIRPGAKQLLQVAKDKGVHLALVSGASTIFVTKIVDTLTLDTFFDFFITSEDVSQKKPHPECYLLAMEKMSVSNDQVIVFEDTEAGLKAANSAGIASIFMLHFYNQARKNSSQALSVYNSFEDDYNSMGKDINAIFDLEIF